MRRSLLWVMLLWGMATAAHAQTRGVLTYPDGTTLPGVLLEGSGEAGVFRSERFGEIRFGKGEASFEPAPVDKKSAPRSPWRPDSWSIGLAGYWQTSNGTQESDAALDLAATWETARNQLDLSLSTDYRVVSDAVDNNEQNASLRWLHDWRSPWVSLVGLRAHRHTFTYDPYPTLDYLLYQGTLGLGVRKKWSDDSKTLVALSHERIGLELLDYNARVYSSATSLLVQNNLQLSAKVSFDQTLTVYLWHDGDTGIDSQAEISYAVTEQLSVGLRHEYRRNAVNLDIGSFSKLSLTTRLEF